MERESRLAVELGAGLTVALVALPQAIAYAMLAGVPPIYGLATAAVTAVVAAACGKSAQVATGPTNTTGLLVLGAMTPFLGANGLIGSEGLPTLALLTLLAGLLRIALALAGGTTLLRFLPESVLAGFTAGAATLIAGMQLDEALGLPPVRATGLREQVFALAGALDQGQMPSVAAIVVAVTTLLLVIAGRRLGPRVPSTLLVVVAATVVVRLAKLDSALGLALVHDRAPVPSGWPTVALPRLDAAGIEALFVPATAIVLLGTLELAVSARAGGARPDMRREILAQGWANVAGAFTGCFPASASFTRSALLRMGGARTRWAAAASGLAVVPALFFGSSLVGFIPQAALAAVLFAVAYAMVDKTAIRRLWRATPETRLLLVLTYVATLVLPIEWAVLLGSGTGLMIHLAKTSAPRLRLLRPEGARMLPLAAGEGAECVVLEVSGNLHYAAVPPFMAAAPRLIPPGTRHVVLDLSHAHEIRFTALQALEQLAEQLARDGGRLILAGVDAETQGLIERSGSALAYVPSEHEPGLSVRHAVERLAAADAARAV